MAISREVYAKVHDVRLELEKALELATAAENHLAYGYEDVTDARRRLTQVKELLPRIEFRALDALQALGGPHG